ncbi:MAG TPA: pilin [Candidatus Saccharimonadales bacterium]|nr:pilin [Candidatus Saccharimonadales bacterium]
MRYLAKFSGIVKITFVSAFLSLFVIAPVAANPSLEAACVRGGGTWDGTTCIPAATSSSTAKESACLGSGGTWDGTTCTSPDGRTVTGTLQQVANILIFIVGAISVIMVIIGAIRYTVAQGDQNAISAAKNTILYAIVGVVLSVAAFGIVGFVTGQFS